MTHLTGEQNDFGGSGHWSRALEGEWQFAFPGQMLTAPGTLPLIACDTGCAVIAPGILCVTVVQG